jgi:PPOX class probable F420-dependent enzyme
VPRPMTEAETREFLTSGTRTGKLAVVKKNGAAMVVPIWFVLDDSGALVFNTGADTTKGRAILRDARVSICVDDDGPPYSFVRVDGVAETSDDVEGMLPWATAIARRYMGDALAEQYGHRNAVAGELLVRVVPARIVALAGVSD